MTELEGNMKTLHCVPRLHLALATAAAACAGCFMTVAAAPPTEAAGAMHTIDTVGLLVKASGLTPHQICVVAHVCAVDMDDVAVYENWKLRLHDAVGEVAYQDLTSTNRLSNADVQHLIVVVRARTGEKVVVNK